jgi:hypothetical protein
MLPTGGASWANMATISWFFVIFSDAEWIELPGLHRRLTVTCHDDAHSSAGLRSAYELAALDDRGVKDANWSEVA